MPNYPEHKYPDRKKMTPHERGLAGGRNATRPIEERMAERTDLNGPNGCHIWTGAITWHGYGQITWKGKVLRAHQVAWMLAGNEKPVEPMVLHHTCENPLCVNPAHLKEVTRYENAVLLSRSPWGVNKRKTHCKRGHEFTPENTETNHRGYRQCKACVAWRAAKTQSY